MAIPIWSEDLASGRISKLARFVRNRWPNEMGAAPSTLSAAQQLVARGLGYKDLHDLQKSVVTAERWPVPHDWIAVTDELAWNLANATSASIPQANDFAMRWPLREFRIGLCYSEHGYVKAEISALFDRDDELRPHLDDQRRWLHLGGLDQIQIGVVADGQVLVGEALENSIDIAGQRFGHALSTTEEADKQRLSILESKILRLYYQLTNAANVHFREDPKPRRDQSSTFKMLVLIGRFSSQNISDESRLIDALSFSLSSVSRASFSVSNDR